MKTNRANTDRSHPDGCQYALRKEANSWEVTFEGRQATFKHELGANYVAYLLLHPPPEPIHGVALALLARERFGQPPSPDKALQQRVMGLEDAASVRTLWRRQRELERVLEDRHEIEPVKAEALRELEEITEHLRQSPWLSRHGAERRAHAVNVAIKRLHDRLAAAVDAAGKPDAVLRAFAQHLHEYLLVPSGRGGAYARTQAVSKLPGCFIYAPPPGVVWNGGAVSSQAPNSEVQGSGFIHPPQYCPPSAVPSTLRSAATEDGLRRTGYRGREVQGSTPQRPAAVEYLSLFLCTGLALLLLATGCAAPRPLKGGRAVTTRKPTGQVEQTLMQGENPAQATKQSQETVKVRTYTLPAGSRIEQPQTPAAAPAQLSTIHPPQSCPPSAVHPPQYCYGGRVPLRRTGYGGRVNSQPINLQPSTLRSAATEDGSTFNPQPSTTFTLAAPMPVVEREEIRAGTELGAAQKDTARELGAKLSSLKGIVWVGVGLFVFGLASLVYPPLKVVVASVTTSAALMLGGVALMVLPSVIVGNELLILGGVGLAVGGWFLAHRHGQLSGTLAASTAAQAPVGPIPVPSPKSPVTSNK
jgi:hypothetical protein